MNQLIRKRNCSTALCGSVFICLLACLVLPFYALGISPYDAETDSAGFNVSLTMTNPKSLTEVIKRSDTPPHATKKNPNHV